MIGPELQEPSVGGSLIPPRPNPGPEPWPEPPGTTGWVAPVVAGLILLLGIVLWIHKRRKTQRLATQSSTNPVPQGELTPREWFIQASERLRDALIEGFGPDWRARTTEEIARDLRLRERLNAEEMGWLLGILEQADRAKFGGVEPNSPGDGGENLERIVDRLVKTERSQGG